MGSVAGGAHIPLPLSDRAQKKGRRGISPGVLPSANRTDNSVA